MDLVGEEPAVDRESVVRLRDPSPRPVAPGPTTSRASEPPAGRRPVAHRARLRGTTGDVRGTLGEFVS
jgi:hypothetical protein